MADEMVSYAREDTAFVRELDAGLAARGQTAWIDWDDLLPGAPVRQEIFDAIASASAIVLVLTPAWLDSEYCRQELDYAVSLQKRLVPVLASPVDMARVPAVLHDINWVRFDARPRAEAFDQLLQAITLDLARIHTHTRLLNQARRWQSAREASRLLRGRELDEAEAWLKGTTSGSDAQPTPLHVAFIIESRRAETARQRRLLTAVTVSLVITVVLATAAFIFFQSAEARRKTAQSRLLAAESDTQRDAQVDLAFLLASHAYELDTTVQAQSTLLRVLLDHAPLQRILSGARGGLEAVAIAPDGRTVAAGDSRGTLFVWDGRTGAVQATAHVTSTEQNVMAVAFHPTDGIVSAASLDGTVASWQLAGNALRPVPARSWESAVPQYALAYSPDGRYLAAGDLLGVVTIRTVASPEQPPVLLRPDHDAPVTALAFSRTGAYLAIGRGDQRITVHRAAAWEPAVASVPQQGRIAGLAFSADDRELVAGGDQRVRLWRLDETPSVVETKTTTAPIASLTMLADGDTALVGLKNGEVVTVPLRGVGTPAVLRGHHEAVNAVAASAPGGVIATAGKDGRVLIWGAIGSSYLTRRAPVHRSDATELRFATDDARLASADLGATLALWNRDDGRVAVMSFADRLAEIDHLRFSADGRRLLLVSETSGILAVDPASGAAIGDVAPITGLAGLASFVSDRQFAGVTLDGTLVLLDEQLREKRRCAPPVAIPRVMAMAIDADRRQLAIGSNDGTIGVIDVTACRYAQTPHRLAEAGIMGLAFVGGGRLAAALETGDLLVWDPQGKAAPMTLSSGSPRLMSLAHSATASLVATGDADGRIALWDTRSWQRVGPLLRAHHDTFVQALAFSADGTRLGSVGADGDVTVWNVDRASWAAMACALASRPLLPEERARFDLRDEPPCRADVAAWQPWPEARLPEGLTPREPLNVDTGRVVAWSRPRSRPLAGDHFIR